MKKLFIKICKLLGFEILDQNNFYSPTLEKNLNEELSIINEKSIILPLGQVKITKKVSSILIIFRMNTDVEIWDQNRKRLFELPKIEYSKRSINSLIKAIEYFKSKYSNIHIKTIIVDDNSNKEIVTKIEPTEELTRNSGQQRCKKFNFSMEESGYIKRGEGFACQNNQTGNWEMLGVELL